MRKNTPKYVISLAKDLRRNQTEAEKTLWERLRGNKLDGHKFYRQCPIGRYIADFYCPELRLVIELDGGIHDDEQQQEYDRIRQEDIECRSITVLRFRNEQVLGDSEEVLRTIRSYASPEANPYIEEIDRFGPYLEENKQPEYPE